jgi:hypothetical protein
MPVLQIVLLAWGGEGLFRPSLISKITPRHRVVGFVDDIVWGEIATFLDIDLKAPWLDLNRLGKV